MTEPSRAFDETIALLHKELSRAPGPVKEVAAYLSSSLGKGVRIKMLLICAMDKTGRIAPDAVRAAAAVELLHMATLVHDDIIDESELRRGIPAVHNKFGKEKAVLGGDWLLCLAFRQILEVNLPEGQNKDHQSRVSQAKIFARTAERLCLGELDERNNLANVDLSARDYLRIIDRKTAALFCLAARGGAEVLGASPKETILCVRFARYFGHLFQIVDDVKDYAMGEEAAGKSVQNDLLTGVITMPLILAFDRDPALKILALDIIKSRAGLDVFLPKLFKTDAFERGRRICHKYAQKARSVLNDKLMEHRREAFSTMVDKVLEALPD